MIAYNDAINYLYGLQKYGIKLGLGKTAKIASLLGDPQKKFLSIHIAGTNGKGSVSAMTASILSAHGFKVGLFTSPHLVSFTERIRINNEQISESDVVSLTEEIKSKIQNSKFKIPEPTFFEFVTVMAFLYFARNNVDWAVVEVGMGGRLDATNIIMPEVSVITKIGLDHKEFLGETLKEIAGEKAGIIKNGIPVISSMQQKEAEDVICSAAEERSSCLYVYGKDFSGILKSCNANGIVFDYNDSTFNIQHSTFNSLFVPLAGDHQLINACVAIKAAMIALKGRNASCLMRNKFKEDIFDQSRITDYELRIRDGLSATKWHGRLEIVSRDPMIIIDGAHNPDAAKVLSEFAEKYLNDYKIILIIGIMSDKDIAGILSPLLPIASDIIFTSPNYGRAASPQMLAEYASQIGFHSRIANSVKEAIEMAIKDSNELQATSNKVKENNSKDSLLVTRHSSLILITGSFYTIGEAMEALGKKPILGNLRETV